MKIKFLLIFVILSLYYLILLPSYSFASDLLENWIEIPKLPSQTASHTTQLYKNKIYVIAGGNTIDIPNTLYTNIDDNGLIQQWNSSAESPYVHQLSGVIKDNHIYLLGGTTPSINSSNTVYVGNIDNNGIITAWNSLNVLPKKLSISGATILGNKIYIGGGIEISNGSILNVNQNIYSAQINPDGTIGNWIFAGLMPKPLSGFGMVANNNSLLIIGGEDANNQDQSAVYFTSLNSDGSIGQWKTANILPQPVYRSSIVNIDNKVVSIGGLDNGIGLEEVYYANINSDGTLGEWQTSSNFLPQPICCGAAVASDYFIYQTGGYNPNLGYLDSVYYTKINTTTDLSVPAIKQTSDPWQAQEYDSAHIWNPSNPTINAWGCAMTSAAMIFRYYGINELPDGTVLDPGTLNTWLKNQPDGYVETGWVNWIALSRLSKLATSINHITSFDALEYQRTQGANTTQLTTDLNNSQPDILEEPGHFIVATGINGNTFDVNDPYYSRSTLNDGYNNSFLSLGQYIPAHTDLSYIMLVTDPKTTLTVTNKNGTSVGSSFIQSPIINPLNSSQKNSSIKIYYLPKPDNGNYTVSATNANNLIKITSYLYDQQGNPEIQQLSGFINVSITLKFNKSNSSNSSAKKLVTFDSTIQDIKTAGNLHSINAALAASLIAIVQNAKTQSSKHKDITKALLNSGIKLLNDSKNYPILISQDTYSLLSNDFNTLINSL